MPVACYKHAKLPELLYRHTTLFQSIVHVVTGILGSLVGSAGLILAASHMAKMLTKVLPLVVGSDGRIQWMKPRQVKKPSSRSCYVHRN